MMRPRALRSLPALVLFAGAAASFACVTKPAPNTGTDPAATTAPTPTPTAAPAPLSCDDFCNKVNTVPGCATDPASIPACASLCKSLQASACKSKEEAALLCVAGANLKCNGAKVDLGACEAQTKDADDCFKTLPPPG
jgi:hypothetical protein